MNLLLDTKALILFDTSPNLLPARTLMNIRNRKNRVFVSDITAWEISIKFNIGKLPQAAPLYKSYRSSLQIYGFEVLRFSTEHALMAGGAITPHQDPFDRALVAQAILEDLTLVTNDSQLINLPDLKTLWA
jgi:PIN domain nuclease of toxin-antitoxin system